MASLYLQFGDNTNVDPDLGYALLSLNGLITEINEDLIIQPEINAPYYNKTFTAALNSGTISQAEYDARIQNQGDARDIYEFNTNVTIQKQDLIDLANAHGLLNVDSGGTAPQILEDIINEGYQVVKKL